MMKQGGSNQEARDRARRLFYSPAEGAKALLEYYDFLGQHPGLGWGVPSLDRTMLKMRPGDVVGLIARPGHGKSTMLAYLARHHARQIAAQGKQEQECTVYVTLEQSVEEVEVLLQAGTDHTASDFMAMRLKRDEVVLAGLRRPKLPVWVIGRSTLRRRSTLRLTVDNLYLALEAMEEEFNIKPRLICLDYIQIVPVERARERQDQVTEAILRSKELAQAVGCPLVMGVQASRSVDAREDKIPTLADCQWSSALEQVADKLYGAWRPWLTNKKKPIIHTETGREYLPTRELLVMRKQKERFSEWAGESYIINMQPGLVNLCDLELEYAAQEPALEL